MGPRRAVPPDLGSRPSKWLHRERAGRNGTGIVGEGQAIERGEQGARAGVVGEDKVGVLAGGVPTAAGARVINTLVEDDVGLYNVSVERHGIARENNHCVYETSNT